MRPIGIDLFTGAGGLSLGFEQAGFDVVAAVEIDPIHCATHEFNFPNCKVICRDLSLLSGNEIRAAAGIGKRDVDVVFGGPPCQGFSMIGKRVLEDPRNSLIRHYVRIIREIAPKYFVFENVKGLTVGAHKILLDEIVALLSEEYDVLLPYRVLNAADYKVPQDRKRLFLLGARKGLKLPKYPLPTGRVTIAEALADIPDAEQFASLIEEDCARVKLGKPSEYAKSLREIEGASDHFGFKRVYDPRILTSSMRAEHTKLSRKRFSETLPGETEPVSRFHKLDPSSVCNTLRAGTNSDRGAFTSPRPIHYKFNRCITVREAARLHSYPDWFRFHVTKWHGFRQVGNSVPPLLGRAVANEIAIALGYRAKAPAYEITLGDPKLLTLNRTEASERYGVPTSVIPSRIRITVTKAARTKKYPRRAA